MAINQLVVVNVPLASTATEYSFQVPPGAKHLSFGLRPNSDSADLYWYLTSVGNNDITGQSDVPYNTVAHADPDRHRHYQTVQGGQTIYFQTSNDTEVLEIDYIIDP